MVISTDLYQQVCQSGKVNKKRNPTKKLILGCLFYFHKIMFFTSFYDMPEQESILPLLQQYGNFSAWQFIKVSRDSTFQFCLCANKIFGDRKTNN